MAASSAGLHEPEDRLSAEAIDDHRALVSLMEELEAVDWYRQRAEAAVDHELAGILVHNRDEEKEHAAMVLEWLRRRDPVLDQHLRTYLFTSGSILQREAEAESEGDAAPSGEASAGSLGIGDLRNPGS
jgi:ferritin-like protein